MEKQIFGIIVSLMDELSEFKDLKLTVSNSVKNAAITTLIAGAGGLQFGSKGLFLGGVIGGLCSYLISPDFKSLSAALQDLSEKDKKKLVNKVVTFLRSYGIDIMSDVARANNLDPNIVRPLGNMVVEYLVTEAGYKVESS